MTDWATESAFSAPLPFDDIDVHFTTSPVVQHPRKARFRLVHGKPKLSFTSNSTKDSQPSSSSNGEKTLYNNNLTSGKNAATNSNSSRSIDNWSVTTDHFTITNDSDDPFSGGGGHSTTFDDDRSIFDEFFIDLPQKNDKIAPTISTANHSVESINNLNGISRPPLQNNNYPSTTPSVSYSGGQNVKDSGSVLGFTQQISNPSIPQYQTHIGHASSSINNIVQHQQSLQPAIITMPQKNQKRPAPAKRQNNCRAQTKKKPAELSNQSMQTVLAQNGINSSCSSLLLNNSANQNRSIIMNNNVQPPRLVMPPKNNNKVTIQLSIDDQKNIQWLTEQLTKILNSRDGGPLTQEDRFSIDMLERQRKLILERAILLQQQPINNVSTNNFLLPSATVPQTLQPQNPTSGGFVVQTAQNGVAFTQNLPGAVQPPSFMPGHIVQINGIAYLAVPTTMNGASTLNNGPHLGGAPAPLRPPAQIFCTNNNNNNMTPLLNPPPHRMQLEQRQEVEVMMTSPKTTTLQQAANVISTQNSIEKQCYSRNDTQLTKQDEQNRKLSINLKIKAKYAEDREKVANPDFHTPFANKSDAFNRLLAYHVVDEPNMKEEFWRIFDKKYAESFAILDRRKRTVLAKMQCMMLKEAAKPCPSEDLMLMDQLWVENEKECLVEEKQLLYNHSKEVLCAKEESKPNKTLSRPTSSQGESEASSLPDDVLTRTSTPSALILSQIDACIESVRQRVIEKHSEQSIDFPDSKKLKRPKSIAKSGETLYDYLQRQKTVQLNVNQVLKEQTDCKPTLPDNIEETANLFDSFEEIINRPEEKHENNDDVIEEDYPDIKSVSILLGRLGDDVTTEEPIFDYRYRLNLCKQYSEEENRRHVPCLISPQSSTSPPTVVEDSLRKYMTSYYDDDRRLSIDSRSRSSFSDRSTLTSSLCSPDKNFDTSLQRPIMVVKEMSPELHPVKLVNVNPPKLILRITTNNFCAKKSEIDTKKRRRRKRKKATLQPEYSDEDQSITTISVKSEVWSESSSSQNSSNEIDRVVKSGKSLNFMEPPLKKVPPLKIRLNKPNVIMEPLTKLSTIGLESSDDDEEDFSIVNRLENPCCKVEKIVNCTGQALAYLDHHMV